MGAEVYLVLGPEEKDCEDKIAGILKSSGVGERDVKNLYAFSADDVDAMLRDLEAASLFSDRSFDVMNSAEQLSRKDARRLASAIGRGRDGAYLVLRSERTKLSSDLDCLVGKDRKFVFYEMFESKKVPYVVSLFSKRGYRISDSTAAVFLALTEHDKKSMEVSATTLINSRRFAGDDRPTVTDEDVFACLDFTREDDSLQIFSYVAKKDLTSAVMSSDLIFGTSKSYSQVISGLVLYVRKSVCVMESGLDSDGAWNVSAFGQKPQTIRFPSEKDFIRNFARNYSQMKAKRMLMILERGETEMRKASSPSLQRSLMAKILSAAIRL